MVQGVPAGMLEVSCPNEVIFENSLCYSTKTMSKKALLYFMVNGLVLL